MKKNAIIIGGSTGIGFNIAKKLSNLNYNLTIVSSNYENLSNAKNEILKYQSKIKVRVLKFDLSKEQETNELINIINEEDLNYTLMLYCVGKAFYGDHLKASSSIKKDIVNLHIFSYVRIVDFFTDHMIRHGNKSYLVSIGSLSGINPNPNLLLYGVTKNFIQMYSKTLSARLKYTNINSTLILPGQTMTKFIKNNNINNLNKDYLTPEQVASESVKAIFKNKKIVVPGFLNKIRYLLFLILPNYVIQYIYRNKK